MKKLKEGLDVFDGKSWDLQLWTKQVLQAKMWCFPNPNQVVLVPNLNQNTSTALTQDKMENVT